MAIFFRLQTTTTGRRTVCAHSQSSVRFSCSAVMPSNDCFLRRPIETTKKSRWKRDDALGRWWVRKKANVCVFLLPTSAAAPTNRKGSHTEGTEGEECAVSRELRTTNKPTVVMPSSPSLLYWDLWPLFWVLGVCCIRNVSKFSKSRFWRTPDEVRVMSCSARSGLLIESEATARDGES